MYVGVPTDPLLGTPAAERPTHLPPPPFGAHPFPQKLKLEKDGFENLGRGWRGGGVRNSNGPSPSLGIYRFCHIPASPNNCPSHPRKRKPSQFPQPTLHSLASNHSDVGGLPMRFRKGG